MNEVLIKEYILKKREKYLQIIKKAEIEISKSPEGSLRCQNRNGKSYYFCDFGGQGAPDFRRKYIPIADIKLARDLAAKQYNKKLCRELRAQVRAIENFLKAYDESAAEEIYHSMNPGRRKLVQNKVPTMQELAAAWDAASYEPYNGYPERLVHMTDKQHNVRSKSELIIANKLYAAPLHYHYEQLLILEDHGYSVEIHPDFTIFSPADGRIYYWEHFGLMDDPDYQQAALQKIQLYAQNGIFLGDRLVATFESAACPLDIAQVNYFIKRLLG